MIVYIAQESRQSLIDQSVIDERNVFRYIAPDNGISLHSFMKSKMPRHTACTDIVIDRQSISEHNDDLLNTLRLFKEMYEIRITLIADDLSDDSIIKLLDMQIYNIVTLTGEQLQSELIHALTPEGINQLKWLRLIQRKENKAAEEAEQAVAQKHDKHLSKSAAFIFAFLIAIIAIIICFLLLNKKSEKETVHTDSEINQMIQSTSEANQTSYLTSKKPISTAASVVTTPVSTTTETITTAVTTTQHFIFTTEVATSPATTSTSKSEKTTTSAERKTTITAKATTTTKKTTTTALVTIPKRGLKIISPAEVGGIITLRIGGTAQLFAQIQPDNATDKAVVWSSKDPSKVIIDSNGMITAVGAGSTIIKCTTKDGQFEVGIMVTVKSA